MIVPKTCLHAVCSLRGNPGHDDGEFDEHFAGLDELIQSLESREWLIRPGTKVAVCGTCRPGCTCDDDRPPGHRHVGHCTTCPRASDNDLSLLPADAPDAIGQIACVELHCDGCGTAFTDPDTDARVHFPDPDGPVDAYEAAKDEWTFVGPVGGQAFCDSDICAKLAEAARQNYYGNDQVMDGQLVLEGFDHVPALGRVEQSRGLW